MTIWYHYNKHMATWLHDGNIFFTVIQKIRKLNIILTARVLSVCIIARDAATKDG